MAQTRSREFALPSDVNDDYAVLVEEMNTKLKKRKKKRIIWFLVLAIVGVLAVIGKRQYDYSVNFQNAVYEIIMSAVDTEEAGGLIHDVWYNSIFKIDDEITDPFTRMDSGSGEYYDDFNDALKALFEDSAFQIKMNSLNKNEADISARMKKLINPPYNYKEAYSELKQLYTAYLEFNGIVRNPRGNLEAFTNCFNDADNELMRCFYPLEMYIS